MTVRIAVVTTILLTGCAGRTPPAAPVQPGTPTSDAEQVRGADVSILFVGNSHTGWHDLPDLVGKMILSRQPTKTVCTHHVPVAHLELAARTPALLGEIESRPWKSVVLQAQKISVSGRYEYSRQEGIDLARRAKARGMTVVFYPEWGLKGVKGDGARQERVYREMAQEADVGVAPVARAWDVALLERPELPLHAGDGNHQSALGAFLTACVLYGRLTGDSPAALGSYPYPGADEKDRAFLAGVAARALAE